MVRRQLGRTGIEVSPIGFGAFKIGRNEGAKYPDGYDLPGESAATALLLGMLDLGINLFDTAPAYGLSEERVGRAFADRRDQVVLSTKAGEQFEGGVSTYDFSSAGIRQSVQRSLKRLRTGHVDVLLVHSDGNDLAIQNETDAVATMRELQEAGLARTIGFSGKTVEGSRAALAWADVIMIEYHAEALEHETVIAEAGAAGVGVLIKKPLASGRLAPSSAITHGLSSAHVTSLVIGGLDLEHMQANVAAAETGG